MKRCKDLQVRLTRVAEGEATPDDALAVGRHVEDCTACRIRLARERRLAEMVSDLGDPIDVDEQFLHDVMDQLPAHAPRRRSRTRGGLRLASKQAR
jgi:anti-sigma factor RsiW